MGTPRTLDATVPDLSAVDRAAWRSFITAALQAADLIESRRAMRLVASGVCMDAHEPEFSGEGVVLI